VGEIGTVFMNTEIEGAPHTWTLEALFPRKRDRKVEKNRSCRGSNAEEGSADRGGSAAKRLYNYAWAWSRGWSTSSARPHLRTRRA